MVVILMVVAKCVAELDETRSRNSILTWILRNWSERLKTNDFRNNLNQPHGFYSHFYSHFWILKNPEVKETIDTIAPN